MAEMAHLPMRRNNGAIRRLDPLEMFTAVQDEMERVWREPFRVGALAFPFRRSATSGADFMPRMDVYEQDNTVVVKAELPGLKKEDIQVELDDDTLVVRG